MIDPAAIRPDEWNLPLFLHVLGAFMLIGSLVMAAAYLFAARDGSAVMARLGYRSLLLGALPALIVTWVAALWIADKEGLQDADVAWIEFGYASTNAGLLVLIAATLTVGFAVRRLSGSDAPQRAGRGVTIAAWLVAFLIVAYSVAIWLMATKPA